MIFDAGFFPIGSDPGALNLNIASSLNGGNLFSFHFSALNTRIFAGRFSKAVECTSIYYKLCVFLLCRL